MVGRENKYTSSHLKVCNFTLLFGVGIVHIPNPSVEGVEGGLLPVPGEKVRDGQELVVEELHDVLHPSAELDE